jgi:Zn finger protein HypA/HybF involved in hydrogenase expression
MPNEMQMSAERVEIRCGSCGHWVLETGKQNGEHRVRCSSCRAIVRVTVVDGSVQMIIEKKKQ